MADTSMESAEKAGFPALARRFLVAAAVLWTSFLPFQTRAQTQDPGNSSVSTSIHVTSEALAAQPVGANWLSYNGDYTGRRFSSLEQITPRNVGQLRVQWVFHVSNSNSMEVTPVVFEGLMFATSANDAFALDAQTGRLIWHYSRPITEGLIDDASQHHNRGVGILGSRLYMETDNAHLLCLDARSGHLLWDVAYAEGNKNYGATTASADLWPPTTQKLENKFGVFGPFPGPASLAPRAGPANFTSAAAALRGCRAPTIQNSIRSIGAPAILLLISMAARGRETICTPTASLPWTPIRENSNGIFNLRRTTFSTTTRRKLRCLSMRSTKASPGSYSCKQIATVISTSWTAPTGNFSPLFLLWKN